jgi:hypothetical protein
MAMTQTLTPPARVERNAFDPRVPGIPGDGSPVLVHVDEARGLTFTWFDISRREQDWRSRERGYLVSRLAVTDTTGTEVGYLNVTHTTAELVAAELPTPFHWADENTGSSFGFHYGEATPQRIWAAAYNDLRITPPSMSETNVWSLSREVAPTDPQILAAELAVAEAMYAVQVEQFVERLSVPFVDFASLDESMTDPAGNTVPLRGTGVGPVMYRIAAQRLALQGKVLRASGIQTPQAEALWRRLDADLDMPTRTVTIRARRGSDKALTYLCLDFTEAAQ